jgi:hypothetical protein
VWPATAGEEYSVEAKCVSSTVVQRTLPVRRVTATTRPSPVDTNTELPTTAGEEFSAASGPS